MAPYSMVVITTFASSRHCLLFGPGTLGVILVSADRMPLAFLAVSFICAVIHVFASIWIPTYRSAGTFVNIPPFMGICRVLIFLPAYIRTISVFSGAMVILILVSSLSVSLSAELGRIQKKSIRVPDTDTKNVSGYFLKKYGYFHLKMYSDTSIRILFSDTF